MLILKNISKKLGGFQISEISLDIPEGTYYVLLGRSGSGKTQLLELIAGLINPDSGEIWLNGENITRTGIQQRKVGLVFQDYAVFPHMTVYENIAYSLTSGRYDKVQVKEKVTKTATELNISHLLDRSTHYLSGGEMQRVALARTLITSPKLLLLDEPMASIDASLKDDIKRLLRLLNRQGLTIIHVTHDYREAVSLASRIGVIHSGRIIQDGTPAEVFGKPANRFVARYAGIRNFYRVTLFNSGGVWKALSHNKLEFTLSGNSYPSGGLMILRSDDIVLSEVAPVSHSVNTFRGIVREILPSGYGFEITVDAGEIFYVDISTDIYNRRKLQEMKEVWLTFAPEAGVVLQGGG